MEALETYELRGYTVSIYPDESGGDANPRSWAAGDITTIYAQLQRYDLADKDVDIGLSLEIMTGKHDDKYIRLPIYMLEHGSVALSTTPFQDKWDSGLVGVIYIERAVAEKEWGDEEAALEYLKAQVDEYGMYVNGEVYCVTVKGGDYEDSCSGLIGFEWAKGWAKDNVPNDLPKPKEDTSHIATHPALNGHLQDVRNALSSISQQEEMREHDRDLMMALAKKTNLFLPEGNRSA